MRESEMRMKRGEEGSGTGEDDENFLLVTIF
jgi:hypothetical protein